MKIQYLNGGLANQVFQYIFMRYLELHSVDGEPVYLDDSFFFVNDVHNGYELEKLFGLHPNLLSQYFDEDVWQYMIEKKKQGISICQSIKDFDMEIEMITGVSDYASHNPFDGKVTLINGNEFHPEITQLPGNIYYHGYWICKDWMYSDYELFRRELSLPPISDDKNKAYAAQILAGPSVSIHIRRGDFVTCNMLLDNAYYRDAVQSALLTLPDATFFVFSDDLQWCREHTEEVGLNLCKKVVYVEGNTKEKSYIDMQLMGYCEAMIICNSSFSYLAGLLSDHVKHYSLPSSLRRI